MKIKTRGSDGHITPDSPFWDTIQHAYKVFARSTPTDTMTCDCCMYPKIRRDFFKHTPRDLPLYYIQDWYNCAIDDPLDQNFWAYILPRVLEILASGEDASMIGLEVTLSYFPTGDKTRWTKAEWAVLDDFQKLFLQQHEPASEDCPDDVLCMFARGGWDPDDLMQQVFEWPTERLVLELYDSWCTNDAVGTVWVTTFWPDFEAGAKQHARWTTKPLFDRLFNFGMATDTHPDLAAKALNLAETILQSPRDWS